MTLSNPFPPELYHQSALAVPPDRRNISLTRMTVSSFVNYDTEFLITLRSTPIPLEMENEEERERRVLIVSFGMSFTSEENPEGGLAVAGVVADILNAWQMEQTFLQLATMPPGENMWGILAESPHLFLPIPSS